MPNKIRNLDVGELRLGIRVSSFLNFLILTLCLLLIVGCSGGTNDDSRVKIWGAILLPGNAVDEANTTGSQSTAKKPIALYRVDDSGKMIGDLLATGTSDDKGNYSLRLADKVEFSSDLLVEVNLGNGEKARAIVIDKSTDITPISEFLTSRLIDDPNLDLSNLALMEVRNLTRFVESLPLNPQPDLATMLDEIARFSDFATTAKINDLATGNPQLRLSGLLMAPSSDPQVKKPVANHTVKLYRIDNDGRTVGTAISQTTSNAAGVFTLLLPTAEKLSSDLTLRAVVRTYPLHALLTNDLLNIDVRSEYVFTELTQNHDLEMKDLPITEIHEGIEYLNSVNIPETNGIVSTLRAIENSPASIEIALRIENIQAARAASSEKFGSSTLGAVSAR
ncbi:MAG: hypothetical protein GY896_11665 [Gammaproteobacteria bacterium]|nr:hypothetical protein [Gammaproteobacteria bacterium]